MREKKLIAHSSPNTIRAKVAEFYQKAKDEVKQHLAKMKVDGVHFSLTFDERSVINSKRYMTINIHGTYPSWHNLGMIRVWDRSQHRFSLKIVELLLVEFGVAIDADIVAMVTDGASIMKRVGRLAG